MIKVTNRFVFPASRRRLRQPVFFILKVSNTNKREFSRINFQSLYLFFFPFLCVAAPLRETLFSIFFTSFYFAVKKTVTFAQHFIDNDTNPA